MYDIIVINKNRTHPSYKKLLSKYPFVKFARTFEQAKSISLTEMFWVVWENLAVDDNFDFGFSPPEYDKRYVHVFKTDSDMIGVCLFPKSLHVSKKELFFKFFANSKNIDIISATEKHYEVYYPTNYKEYETIIEQENTENMFWVIHPALEVLPEFKFDYKVELENDFDLGINHVFLNHDVDSDLFNGALLCSKNSKLTETEFETRMLIEKKEHAVYSTRLRKYDIFFISYFEKDADTKFNKLKEKFPRVVHIKNIKGIHNAHREAAIQSVTPMFWVIDADAEVLDDFDFSLLLPMYDHDAVFVWHSQNPVNNLEYGYGGIKLLPKDLTTYVNLNSVDMTLAISQKINVVEEVSNITVFNIDSFNSWKSAFRECVKLSVKHSVDNDQEAKERLDIWCTVGADKPFGQETIQGALAGRKYGEENADNKSALLLINDFEWLRNHFATSSVAIGNI
jgi:hypothetical protein